MGRKRYFSDPGNMLFKAWLRENRERFNHHLHVRRKGTYILGRYGGIIPEISLVIRENNIDVCIDYHRIFWDMLRSIDVIPARDMKNGYYCTLCEIGPRVYYKSIGELYKTHTFDEILEWSNEWIRPENYLVLNGWSSTWAKIVKQEDLHQWNNDEDLVAIISLRAWSTSK